MGTSYDLAVVGGGNMGVALVGGLLDAGTAAGTIVVVEVAAARRTQLADLLPGVAVVDRIDGVVCEQAVVAVKPGDVAGVVASLATAGCRRLLSIAAGVTTASLAAAAPGVAVLRAMPNTPALVGKGVSALCAGPGATEDDVAWAASVLSSVGTCERVPEHLFDAVTGLTGSGPAYVFLVAEALVDAGVLAGLPRPLATGMVTQLLVGSASLLDERGDAVALRAMVTSPGGTTAAGLRVLEDRSVRAGFIEAVQAAAARSRELG